MRALQRFQATGWLMLLMLLGASPAAAKLVSVSELDGYGVLVAARLVGGGLDLRMVFPVTPACAAVLRPEAAVEYQKSGPFGQVSSADGVCVATGTASLEAWRDRQPRAEGRLNARKTARFEAVGGDGAVALVRGRFPLATRVGFGLAHDLYALIPRTAACAGPLAEGEAFMEFRQSGRDPFRLGPDKDCAILGFATPTGR